MIHYLVTAEAGHTLTDFLAYWAPQLASQIQLLHYEDLGWRERFPTGAYIFSDLERLSGERMALAVRLWTGLSAAGDKVRLLNDPSKVLGRYELLSRLHERGTNTFAVSRLDKDRELLKLPAFMRFENSHTGSASPLLWTKQDVDKAVVRAAASGQRLRDLMFVEYCDTSDEDGVFRKYSSYLIGGRIIPAHVFFSRRWVVKNRSLEDEPMLESEREYLTSSAHDEFVKDVFALASVDYGRIDYSLLGTQPQVWEINTNPHVLTPPEAVSPEVQRFHALVAKQLQEAFLALSVNDESPDDVALGSIRTSAATAAPSRQPPIEVARRRLVRHPNAQSLVRRLLEVLGSVFWLFRRPILWAVDHQLSHGNGRNTLRGPGASTLD